MRVGLVADTHGLLRPQACALLRGCEHIVHAGDIGDPAILDRLAELAPVTAVRGNNDRGGWADALAHSEFLQLGETWLYVLHDLAELDLDPGAAGVRVVVSGHSHQPRVHQSRGVLFVNPGSCGPRRFKLPIALAELHIDGNSVNARIVEIG
jgi:putative phosphoesterase